MIPNAHFRFELPDMLTDGRAFERVHNRAVREQLTQELENHHRRRMPGHFEATNRAKYKHMERKPGWKAKKMNVWRSRTDLVASGRTKRFMLSTYKITVSGTASSGKGVVGTLRMRFPFPASFEHSTNRVSLQQMAKELQTFTSEEESQMTKSFGTGYTARIKAALANSPKLRKRIGGGVT